MTQCPNCKNQIEKGETICSECGEAVVETITAEETSVKKSFFAKLSDIPKKVKIIGTACIAWILIIVILLSALTNRSFHIPYTLYVKDYELFYVNTQNGTPIQVTSQLINPMSNLFDQVYDGNFSTLSYHLYNHIKVSNDGKIIFYTDKASNFHEKSPFYFRYLTNPKSEPKMIDSLVSTFLISESGKIVTYINGQDDALYRYNLKEKTKIDTDVTQFTISKDGKKVVYIKQGGEIYSKTLGKSRQKLGETLSDLKIVGDDFNSIYFINDGLLCKIENGEKVKKIASDVSEIVKIYETGEIYYLKSKDEQIALKDYLEDDMKAADEFIKNPEYKSYPARWDYETDEEYQKAIQKFEEEYKVYEEDEKLWNQKVSRDNIRDEIEFETVDHYSYSLCYFNGKKETVLRNDVIALDYSVIAEETPAMIFRSADYKKVEKFKISDISSIIELKQRFYQALNDLTMTHLTVKDTTSVIGVADQRNYYITEDAKAVYYVDDINHENDTGNLYKIQISGRKPKKPKTYDTDVLNQFSRIFGDKLLYFKDYDGYGAELYIDKEKLADDVFMSTISYIEASDSYVYLTDWDGIEQFGTLEIYEKGKSVKIADKVYKKEVTPQGEILYFANYDLYGFRGELFAYNNGAPKKIDDEVMLMLSASEMNNTVAYNDNLTFY